MASISLSWCALLCCQPTQLLSLWWCAQPSPYCGASFSPWISRHCAHYNDRCWIPQVYATATLQSAGLHTSLHQVPPKRPQARIHSSLLSATRETGHCDREHGWLISTLPAPLPLPLLLPFPFLIKSYMAGKFLGPFHAGVHGCSGFVAAIKLLNFTSLSWLYTIPCLSASAVYLPLIFYYFCDV